jgi:hypothetical protein
MIPGLLSAILLLVHSSLAQVVSADASAFAYSCRPADSFPSSTRLSREAKAFHVPDDLPYLRRLR